MAAGQVAENDRADRGGGWWAANERALELRCKIAPETMKYFRRVNTLEEAFALLKTWVLDDDTPPFDEIAI
ncbi:MAG: hypothetical protein IPK17_11215 [Chloroflexi bacterium]|uniref:hypothetical protein n=1 Tax=Candidatus Flexifilum breve TaxID=3140694 RepID=UPI003136F4AF|nr:hypothetical protein [Chloroflexota bacterium]